MEFITSSIPGIPVSEISPASLAVYLRGMREEINHVLECEDTKIKHAGQELRAALPFGLGWEHADGDVMGRIGQYCTSNERQAVIIETGADCYNTAHLPKNALILLITNGSSRHMLYAFSGTVSEAVGAFFEGKNYSADGWIWYRRQLEII